MPDADLSSAAGTTNTNSTKDKAGCFGCSLFLTIPMGIWGLIAFFSALSGYEIESIKTSRELKINSDYEMQSEGRERAEFEPVSRKVSEEADVEQRIFSAIFGLLLIGGSVGLMILASKTDQKKQANTTADSTR